MSWLQVVDEEFDALEGFFAVLDHGILQLLENVETYLFNLQVIRSSSASVFHFTAPEAFLDDFESKLNDPNSPFSE